MKRACSSLAGPPLQGLGLFSPTLHDSIACLWFPPPPFECLWYTVLFDYIQKVKMSWELDHICVTMFIVGGLGGQHRATLFSYFVIDHMQETKHMLVKVVNECWFLVFKKKKNFYMCWCHEADASHGLTFLLHQSTTTNHPWKQDESAYITWNGSCQNCSEPCVSGKHILQNILLNCVNLEIVEDKAVVKVTGIVWYQCVPLETWTMSMTGIAVLRPLVGIVIIVLGHVEATKINC